MTTEGNTMYLDHVMTLPNYFAIVLLFKETITSTEYNSIKLINSKLNSS